MNVQAEVDCEREKVGRIATVARRSACPSFGDLLGWGEDSVDPYVLNDNPGVMFESARRIVVFQEICGQLRYYAGGWRSDARRIHLEWERMEAEGFERGIFGTVPEALEFTELFLVETLPLQAIDVPRQLLGRQETAKHLSGV
jgi:hypothetical protein